MRHSEHYQGPLCHTSLRDPFAIIPSILETSSFVAHLWFVWRIPSLATNRHDHGRNLDFCPNKRVAPVLDPKEGESFSHGERTAPTLVLVWPLQVSFRPGSPQHLPWPASRHSARLSRAFPSFFLPPATHCHYCDSTTRLSCYLAISNNAYNPTY